MILIFEFLKLISGLSERVLLTGKRGAVKTGLEEPKTSLNYCEGLHKDTW